MPTLFRVLTRGPGCSSLHRPRMLRSRLLFCVLHWPSQPLRTPPSTNLALVPRATALTAFARRATAAALCSATRGKHTLCAAGPIWMLLVPARFPRPVCLAVAACGHTRALHWLSGRSGSRRTIIRGPRCTMACTTLDEQSKRFVCGEPADTLVAISRRCGGVGWWRGFSTP